MSKRPNRLTAVCAAVALSVSVPLTSVRSQVCIPKAHWSKWCETSSHAVSIPYWWGKGFPSGPPSTGEQLEIMLALLDWRTVSQLNWESVLSFPAMGNCNNCGWEEFQATQQRGILFTFEPLTTSTICSGSQPLTSAEDVESRLAQAFVTASIPATPGSPIEERAQVVVRFNSNVAWTQPFLALAARHEIGHALGLADIVDGACSGHLMSSPISCPGPGDPIVTAVDYSATVGGMCLYGDFLGEDCESAWGVDWINPFSDTDIELGKGFCNCSRLCQPASSLDPAGTAAPYTYELAINESGGPYTLFATLQESDWVGNRYVPTFSQAYSAARCRMRVFDGGTQVGEAFTTGTRDLSIATAAPPRATSQIGFVVAPNPTHDSAQIQLSLPREEEVRVDVYDVSGRRIATIHDGPLGPGDRALEWRGRGTTKLANGLYYVVVQGHDWRVSHRLVWLR